VFKKYRGKKVSGQILGFQERQIGVPHLSKGAAPEGWKATSKNHDPDADQRGKKKTLEGNPVSQMQAKKRVKEQYRPKLNTRGKKKGDTIRVRLGCGKRVREDGAKHVE